MIFTSLITNFNFYSDKNVDQFEMIPGYLKKERDHISKKELGIHYSNPDFIVTTKDSQGSKIVVIDAKSQ